VADLVVRTNKKGRGLYANRPFRKGETIVEDPVLIFPSKEATDRSIVHKYTFEWPDEDTSALALGLGSLINHSYEPNAVYSFLWRQKRIRFYALRAIRKGEEILMNYNGDPEDTQRVAFRLK
jgi:uncharacterized protein